MPSDRRILVIYSEASGGMAHYAKLLHEGLTVSCNCSLYCISSDDGLTERSSLFRYLDRNIFIFKLRRKYNRFRYFRIARTLVAQFKPDHIHLTHFFPGTYEIVRILKRQGISVSLTIHDPKPHEERRTLWGSLLTAIISKTKLPQTLYLVDRIHVHSNSHRAMLRTQYPRLKDEDFYVVQHGAGASKEVLAGAVIPHELESLNCPVDCAVVLFFGRIEPYKGLSILFEALSSLSSSKLNFKIIVAGAGLIHSIPASISDRLILINRFVNDEEIGALFKSASFVVLPYLSGTQTGVIPLASIFNLPCVASRVGALPELILEHETGLLATPGDVADLAASLYFYLSQPELAKRHGEAASRFLQQRCGWERVSKQHLQEFERISTTIGNSQIPSDC